MDILIKMQIPRVPALAKWERKGERERERELAQDTKAVTHQPIKAESDTPIKI
jgi:hypothetical protein